MSTIQTIYLCPPTYFEIEYEINPWMNKNNPVDKAQAILQYEQLKNTYNSLGVEIVEMKPKNGLPDMVYASDWGFSINDTFIPSQHRNPQRREEVRQVLASIQNRGCQIHLLPDEHFFEGEGDLLFFNKTLFYGYGQRSAKQSAEEIKKILPYPIHTFELTDPKHFHLDTALGFLREETVLCVENAFSPGSLDKLHSMFTTVIALPQEDVAFFGTNYVMVDDQIIIAKGISQKLRSIFEAYKFSVIEVEMSEFIKGGGSVSCVSHLVHNG